MTDEERSKLFAEVRTAVAKAGIPSAEIARRSAIDKASLSRFLSGTTGLSVPSLERVAAAVGLEIVVRRKKK
jgi:hypothetical protein